MSVNVNNNGSSTSPNACQSGMKVSVNQGQTYNMNFGNSGLSFTNNWQANEIDNLNNITYGITNLNNNSGVQQTREQQFITGKYSLALGNYLLNANALGVGQTTSYTTTSLFGTDSKYGLYAYPWSDNYQNNVGSNDTNPLVFLGQSNYCNLGMQISSTPNPYACPTIGGLRPCNVSFSNKPQNNVQKVENVNIDCYYDTNKIQNMPEDEQLGTLIALAQIGGSDGVGINSLNNMTGHLSNIVGNNASNVISTLTSANNGLLIAPTGVDTLQTANADSNFNEAMSNYCTLPVSDANQCNYKPWDSSTRQNGCSRMTSLTIGGALCRSWFKEAKVADPNSNIEATYTNYSNNYCQQHPENDDCSCIQWNYQPTNCSSDPTSFRCLNTLRKEVQSIGETQYQQCVWPGCFSTYNISTGNGTILQNYQTTPSTIKYVGGASGGLACPDVLTQCIQNTKIIAETQQGNVNVSNIKNYINCVTNVKQEGNTGTTVFTGGTGTITGATGATGASGATGAMTIQEFSQNYWWVYLIAGVIVIVIIIVVVVVVVKKKKEAEAKKKKPIKKSKSNQEQKFQQIINKEPQKKQNQKFQKIINTSQKNQSVAKKTEQNSDETFKKILASYDKH